MNYHSEILCDLIERFSPNGIGVELGINRGLTSEKILTTTSTKILYMIDPWIWCYDKNQGLYSTKHNPDDDYEYVLNHFSQKFPKKHILIRKKSEEAVNDIQEKLDFIFIDGNHTYNYVMKDLELWMPKIKSEGLVVGHDWWKKFPDVERAVTDFCEKNNIFHAPHYKIDNHIPAPSKNPIIMKSWPRGHLWWTIKK